jgi:hypothetical protein
VEEVALEVAIRHHDLVLVALEDVEVASRHRAQDVVVVVASLAAVACSQGVVAVAASLAVVAEVDILLHLRRLYRLFVHL